MYQFPAAPTSLRIRKSSNFFVAVFGGMWLVFWVGLILFLVVFPLESELRIAIIIFLLVDITVLPLMIGMLSKQKPLYYELDGKKLRVKRSKPYNDLEWDLSAVTKIEAKKNYPLLRVSRRRKSNNQGVFAISGTVWNQELGGWLRVALSSEEDYILFSGDKFGYAVSPQDIDGLMRAARQELGIS